MKPTNNVLSIAAERHLNELRDVADQDYILSRAAFRSEFDAHFIWLAQQAIEKYLKVLLVFNGLPAKDLEHNLDDALQRLAAVTDIPFALPYELAGFVAYVNRRFDRYAETPYSVTTERLVQLDMTVWYLRRFCLNFRGNKEARLRRTEEEIAATIQHYSGAADVRHPYRFRPIGGVLETVLYSKSANRAILTWNNLYFARRKRIAPKYWRSRAVNSYLSIYPQVRTELGAFLKLGRGSRKR